MTPEQREMERARKRAYYHANKERMKAQNRAWVAANRDRANEIARAAYRRKDKAAVAEASRRRRASSPETNRAATKRWREKNRDRHIEMVGKWMRNNPEKRKAHSAARRARKAGAECSVTPAEWRALIVRFSGRCAYCQCVPDKLTMDHVVALSNGGDHTSDNIVPACMDCNRRKHRKSAARFIVEIGRT